MLPLCLLGALLTACGGSPEASRLADRNDRFPLHPDTQMTPGEVCDQPDTYRYPEHIAYCERNVSTETKQDIIRKYDDEFNYSISAMPRTDFKIDHFIPLCMGGSNHRGNLWPQHKSVFNVTDPLEQKLCELMAAGTMQQAEAIATIKRAKFNLDQVPTIETDIDSRLSH